jgi:hypothetical protein
MRHVTVAHPGFAWCGRAGCTVCIPRHLLLPQGWPPPLLSPSGQYRTPNVCQAANQDDENLLMPGGRVVAREFRWIAHETRSPAAPLYVRCDVTFGGHRCVRLGAVFGPCKHSLAVLVRRPQKLENVPRVDP